MFLSRKEIEKALKQWNLAWDNHDLEGVMALFHEIEIDGKRQSLHL